MSTAPPPVPPANRSDKGPGDAKRAPTDTAGKGGVGGGAPGNTAQQGQQGNVHQNTTNQGHQQDR